MFGLPHGRAQVFYDTDMRRLIQVLAAVAVAAFTLGAQTAAPPPLVRLYPVALDSAGHPVTDLTAADFKLSDQGKPQDIFLFRRPPAKASSPLGPNEYSNRPGGIMPHAVVVLFDLLTAPAPEGGAMGCMGSSSPSSLAPVLRRRSGQGADGQPGAARRCGPRGPGQEDLS